MERGLKNIFNKFINEYPRSWYWKAYGRRIKNPDLPENPKSFLFVCKGNICRGPFAEHLARKIAEMKGIGHTAFDSAGLEVSKSLQPPEEALSAAEKFGVCLDNHRSKSIDYYMVQFTTMIIAMEISHMNTLMKLFPEFRQKMYLLPLFQTDGSEREGGFSRYNIVDREGCGSIHFLLQANRNMRERDV